MIIYLEGRLSQHDVRRTLSSYASICHMVLAIYALARHGTLARQRHRDSRASHQ